MFRKAERKKAKLRLALCGTSGSGKTYSALRLATGLGGKVAFFDTENGSGDLYADDFEYDIATISPPYSPEKFINAIKYAEKNGYNVLIIDSFTHAWTGSGGILDIHDKATAADRSQNSYMAWRKVTPQHNLLVDTILQSNLHIITTMRSKTEYEIVDDGKGKKKPVKLGLAPIQRDGMEYEFTVVMDIAVTGNIASASKDRTKLFKDKDFVITEETGKELLNWLNTGEGEQERVSSFSEQPQETPRQPTNTKPAYQPNTAKKREYEPVPKGESKTIIGATKKETQLDIPIPYPSDELDTQAAIDAYISSLRFISLDGKENFEYAWKRLYVHARDVRKLDKDNLSKFFEEYKKIKEEIK